MHPNSKHSGFTLIELVVGMVITAIIAGMITVFARWPVQTYIDAGNRATLSDAADTALRRLGRDIRQALPNSLRLKSATCSTGSGTCTFIEFIPIKTAGRYRATESGALNLESTSNQTFDVLGPALCPSSNECTLSNGDSFVLYNLGSGNSNAYLDPASTPKSNRRLISTTGTNKSSLTLNGSGQGLCKSLPEPYYDSSTDTCNPDDSSQTPRRYELPGLRFYIISDAVSYECPTAANLTLNSWVRHAGYGLLSAQPASFSSGQQTLLTTDVDRCSVKLSDDQQMLIVSLTLKRNGESITLLQQIEVPNAP